MTRGRLTGLDTAFLAAERPSQPLHMMGLLILDPTTVPGGYGFERFRDFLAQQMPVLPPLRRRLVEVPLGLARPWWIEESEIDIDAHVRRAAVPSPGGPREVAEMAAEMMERPLDRSRPLWEMVLVEGLEGGRLALLAKIHHATMDGLAGVKLMAALFGSTPEIGPPPAATHGETEPMPGRIELVARAVPWLWRQPLRAARAGFDTARSALRNARSGEPAPEAPELRAPRSFFNVAISPHRIAATTSLPLAEIRSVGRAADATINDVLLAVVAGALRSYLEPRGELPPEPLVAGVPIAVRDEGDERANAVANVNVSLATDLDDPSERLRALRDAMRLQKKRRGSTLGEDINVWLDVPPPLVFSLLARGVIESGLLHRMDPFWNLLVSSVPGPPESLYLAGARLVGIHPLGPIFDGLALNVTAVGCGGNLDFGLVACRRRMPDLWDLADAIPEALDELVRQKGVEVPSQRSDEAS